MPFWTARGSRTLKKPLRFHYGHMRKVIEEYMQSTAPPSQPANP